MKIRDGVTVLECVIYIMLISTIITHFYPWIGKIQTGLIRQIYLLKREHTLGFARDILSQDIQQAPYTVEGWKLIHEKEIVWFNGKSDIGWKVDKERLVRIQGKYSKENHRWLSRQSSVIFQPIASIGFMPVYSAKQKKYIERIKITMYLSKNDTRTIMVGLFQGFS